MEQQNQTPRQGLGSDWQNPIQAMFARMAPNDRRKFCREQRRQRANWPTRMTKRDLPEDMAEHFSNVQAVWYSRDYSATAWKSDHPQILCRLSIYCNELDEMTGDFLGGLSWDELYRIKNECGFEDLDCVEVFPAADKLVNVSNMRHLWVMLHRLSFSLV